MREINEGNAGRRPARWGRVAAAGAAATLALVGVSASAAPASAAKRHCAVKGAHTLASTGHSRLLAREYNDDDFYGPETDIYVCSTAHKPVLLEHYDSGESPNVSLVRFTRRYVAYSTSWVSSQCTKYLGPDPTCSGGGLASYDRRTGKLRTRAGLPAADLALTQSGWLAWTVPPGLALQAQVGVQPPRALAGGPVDAGSLRADGDTVTWTVAGVAQSATL